MDARTNLIKHNRRHDVVELQTSRKRNSWIGSTLKSTQLFLVPSLSLLQISLKFIHNFCRNPADRQKDKKTETRNNSNGNITYCLWGVQCTCTITTRRCAV